MHFLNWTNDLNTGIGWVDDQHQQIVDYINELGVAKETGDRDKIGAVIDQLIDYTVTHFREEEEMMERAGYRLTDIHKKIHVHFIEEVSDMQAKHTAGLDESGELMHLLENWLFNHIRTNDHGYVAVVKEAGADARPKKAA